MPGIPTARLEHRSWNCRIKVDFVEIRSAFEEIDKVFDGDGSRGAEETQTTFLILHWISMGEGSQVDRDEN